MDLKKLDQPETMTEIAELVIVNNYEVGLSSIDAHVQRDMSLQLGVVVCSL